MVGIKCKPLTDHEVFVKVEHRAMSIPVDIYSLIIQRVKDFPTLKLLVVQHPLLLQSHHQALML
jgi:hypothetical protein